MAPLDAFLACSALRQCTHACHLKCLMALVHGCYNMCRDEGDEETNLQQLYITQMWENCIILPNLKTSLFIKYDFLSNTSVAEM